MLVCDGCCARRRRFGFAELFVGFRFVIVEEIVEDIGELSDEMCFGDFIVS